MDVRNALGRDGDIVDGHGLEVSDAAAESALHQEGVAHGLEALRELGLAHALEFVAAKENWCVVHGFHHHFTVVLAQGAEGRALDVAVEFEVAEEGLEHLELADHGVGGEALLGKVLRLDVRVELGIFVHVEVLVVEEGAELEEHVVVELGSREVREALDGEKALQLVADHGNMGSAPGSKHADILGVVDVFMELRDEGLGVAAGLGYGIAQLLYDLVHHFGEHVQAFLLHLFVCLVHQGDLLIDGVEEVAVVDGDVGLQFAFGSELFEVFGRGFDVGLVGDVGFATVAQTETNGIFFGVFLPRFGNKKDLQHSSSSIVWVKLRKFYPQNNY